MYVYNSTEQYPATLIMIEGEYPAKGRLLTATKRDKQ